jgi:tRNA 2-thiouridine synthesizing protein A
MSERRTGGGAGAGGGGGKRAAAGHDLDLRGLFCPLPVLLTQRALDPLPPGARVTAIGDDPAIHGDVPAWCDEAGHRLVELVALGGEEIRFVVEKAR